MISITSAELNYLVFRYLNESGFTHSAFALGYEAGINKSNIDANLVPPGALVTFIQKGIQYLELEANLVNDDLDVDDDFQLLNPLDLITKDVDELQRIIKEKKESTQKSKSKGKEKENDENGREQDHGNAMEKKKEPAREEYEKQQREKEKERDRERIEKEKERDRERIEKENERERERLEKEKERERERKEKEKERERERIEKEKEQERERIEKEKERDREMIEKEKDLEEGNEKENQLDDVSDVNHIEEDINGRLENETKEGPEPMDICTSAVSLPEIPYSDVTVLEGHGSEVFACAWNPNGGLLASGSGDSTARIWTVDGPSISKGQKPSSVVLRHFKGRTNEKNRDVTTLDWNHEGTLLATGSYDGQARMWNRAGELIQTFTKHKGPIFSLKWNKRGDYLLSGSVDKTAIVWDVVRVECKQQFEFHSAPTLDVDWRNNVSFATCSTDNMIYVCKVGENRPIKTFVGHEGEVNAIKWDPAGSMLASCSDDSTAKIWTMKQDHCLLDLREHTKEIYTVRWSPTGPSSKNPNKQLVLASASFDSTIKLWDVEVGSLLHSFNGHREPVYSVAFSPDGEYLASGSLDKCMHIWSLKEGKIVKTFSGNGGIFEVCWNNRGDKIAACFADNVVCVLDFRM